MRRRLYRVQPKIEPLALLVAPFAALFELFWPILIITGLAVGLLSMFTGGRTQPPRLEAFAILVGVVSFAFGLLISLRGDAEEIEREADALLLEDRRIRDGMVNALDKIATSLQVAAEALDRERYSTFLDALHGAGVLLLHYRQLHYDLHANISAYASLLSSRTHTYPTLNADGSSDRELRARYRKLYELIESDFRCLWLLEQRRCSASDHRALVPPVIA